jgi:glucose-6-phosphate isomerase
MFKILNTLNCPILDVPDLSGRFAGSMSNVAIVPAYLSGINIIDFIMGLEEGYNEFMNFKVNDASLFAIYLYHLYKKGYSNVFSMPYSSNIEGLVGLFVQEVSESTGKDNKGLLGTYHSAPACQHSVLELLLGGTKGIIIPILWLIESDDPDLELHSSIKYIDKKSAQDVVNYQAYATFQALLEQKVPSVLILLGSPKIHCMGNLIAFIQSTIYYLCLLLDVNWANNPKVIIGKEICNKALQENQSFQNLKNRRETIAKEKFKDW